ncbi:hypothetical protein FDENT_3606 [Fusarium denticulatum]|uniref:Uncharacterized protein n=1 Tax=Fusarium denticulatum TaxID=48507 RepID=A0A8H6CT16_9HYPO|nr:hypothetical protein FDENT_3606 [Fusarium denticulatum]
MFHCPERFCREIRDGRVHLVNGRAVLGTDGGSNSGGNAGRNVGGNWTFTGQTYNVYCHRGKYQAAKARKKAETSASSTSKSKSKNQEEKAKDKSPHNLINIRRLPAEEKVKLGVDHINHLLQNRADRVLGLLPKWLPAKSPILVQALQRWQQRKILKTET